MSRCSFAVGLLSAVLVLGTSVVPLAAAQPAGAGVTSEKLYFSVHIGQSVERDCTVVGELFLPAGAGPNNRVPAVLTTNGFGGSYEGQVPMAQKLASEGYAALTYSGLGFGGTTCKISLDNPDYDGRAASQLVGFLGGASGVAFTDPALTQPRSPLDAVVLDAPGDPRVGMVGGSYGGGIQFATAAVDPRLDTIVPMITWNDLSYSLTPNGTSAMSGVSTAVPGASKILFAAALFADGVINPGLSGYETDPARLAGCPNYVPYMCNLITQAVVQGDVSQTNTDRLRQSSVSSYVDRINIPVLLAQGQQDTLFVLNEAVATYEALQARGVETKMIWHSWGHSNGSVPAPGEYSATAPDPETQYETGRIFDWFAKYLKNQSIDTGPEFAYFRDWVPYNGNAAPAYAEASAYPVGTPRDFALSGQGKLTTAGGVEHGEQTIVTGPFGVPTGIEPPNLDPAARIPSIQIPGTEAMWTSAPMTAPLDVAGIADVTLRVAAPGSPVVFAKIYDVAPDGSSVLINGLITPVRIADPAQPVSITLAGIVHRFDAGHSVRLVVAGGDISYRGGLESMPVTIFSDGSGPLRLPVVS